jgi:hypothetical protein
MHLGCIVRAVSKPQLRMRGEAIAHLTPGRLCRRDFCTSPGSFSSQQNAGLDGDFTRG